MIKLTLEFETMEEMLAYLGTAKAAPKKKKAAAKKDAPVATATTPPAPPVTPVLTATVTPIVQPGAPAGAPAAMSPSGITLADVQARAQVVSKALGPRNIEISAIMANDFNVSRASELSPEQYDRFIEAVEALVVPAA